MTSPFAQPSTGGDKFEASLYNGALLLLYPKRYEPTVETKHGVSQAADADIVVVDRPGPDGSPTVFHNAKLFGNLAGSVRDSVGGQVLGRLGQGPNTKGNPPWILLNFTDADVQLALPVDSAYKAGQFAQATGPAAPPAFDPWAGVNAAPAAAPEDPAVAFLISKGIPEAQVRAMDAGTRAAVATTYA